MFEVLELSGHVDIWGLVDTDSTFSVVRTITNNTGITWTGYKFNWSPTILPGYADIIHETLESTKLQTITYPGRWTIEFSGSPPVLNGESFTIHFDVRALPPEFNIVSHQIFIPEPATILLLGLGSLVLLGKRKG